MSGWMLELFAEKIRLILLDVVLQWSTDSEVNEAFTKLHTGVSIDPTEEPNHARHTSTTQTRKSSHGIGPATLRKPAYSSSFESTACALVSASCTL